MKLLFRSSLYFSCLLFALAGPAPPHTTAVPPLQITQDIYSNNTTTNNNTTTTNNNNTNNNNVQTNEVRVNNITLAEVDDELTNRQAEVTTEIYLTNKTSEESTNSTTSTIKSVGEVTEDDATISATETEEIFNTSTSDTAQFNELLTEESVLLSTTKSVEEETVTEDFLPTITTESVQEATEALEELITTKSDEAEEFLTTQSVEAHTKNPHRNFSPYNEEVSEDTLTTTTKSVEEVAEEEHNESNTETFEVTESIFTTSTSKSVEEVPDVGLTDRTDTQDYLTGKERKALISHLHDVDLEDVDHLVLTPRQKTALMQELEVRRLGLEAWSELSPWQRLSREEQLSFNEKYLALPPVLQQYSKLQFTSLPEDRQEHAYRMFLVLDIETLEEVIARELDRQNEVETIFNDERTENLGEFPELRLESESEAGPSPPQIRITAKQLRDLQVEVEQQETGGSSLPSQILQISPEQILQLGRQIDLLENSIDDSIDATTEQYEDGNETSAIEEGVENDDDLTGVEPSTVPPSHTSPPGLYEELEVITGTVTPQSTLYSDDEDDTVRTESPSLYHENYFYDLPTGEDDPAEIPITTSGPGSVFEDVTTQASHPDQTEKTTDKTVTIKDLLISHIKKVNNDSLKSKLRSFPTKKIVFRKKKNPKKSRKSDRQRAIVKISNSHQKRKPISSDARLAAWQKRARSRHAYDPRRTRKVHRLLTQSPTEPTRAELLHFKIAEAQLAKAILLQECLQNASACQF